MPDKLTDVTDNKVGKITDSEIVKALDICSKSTNGCSHSNYTCEDCYLNGQPMCSSVLLQDAIDLINRLQAENESLKAEIERLKANQEMAEGYADALVEYTKAEAYKECIEKVKEKSCKLNMCHNDIVVKTDYQISGEELDTISKELVGDSNGKEV